MKILIAGDFCPSERTVALIENGKYADVFYDIMPFVTSADYSIVNLECPIVDSDDVKPIIKCGPNLFCSHKAVDAIKYVGFKCATLANNHFRDFGDEGCNTTIRALKDAEIDSVGGGKDLKESQKILYKKINGQILALISICEHESSIASDAHAGSAPLDYIDVYNQIIEARRNADFLVLIVHGGSEHYQLPSPRMKKIYRWFIDLGVDAVINHHQHCYSGYEIYKNKPIFYGLGNFCFDNKLKRSCIWNEGFLVMLSLEEKDIEFELIPYLQCDTSPTISLLNEIELQKFYNTINNLNNIIESDEELETQFNNFCKEMSVEWLFNLEPYKRTRLNTALYRRNLLPSFITKDKIKWLINFIECESQVPRLLSSLYSKLK